MNIKLNYKMACMLEVALSEKINIDKSKVENNQITDEEVLKLFKQEENAYYDFKNKVQQKWQNKNKGTICNINIGYQTACILKHALRDKLERNKNTKISDYELENYYIDFKSYIETKFKSVSKRKKIWKEITEYEIEIPKEYYDFIKKLNTKGIKGYFVGGCVRDSLLGIKSTDFDMFCLCTKETFIIKNRKLRIVVDFENVLIVEDQQRDIFTISFGISFRHDFKKRDFTINSIYYDSINKVVFGFPISFEDIDNKVLRPCNEQCFHKDSLKLLRGLRFKDKYDLDTIFSYLDVFSMDLKDIDTKFKAYRLRNEFLKHNILTLNKFLLVGKIVDKLREFEITI